MVDFLLEPVSFGFMQRGLLASVLVAIICGALGSFVVLKGLAFIGDAPEQNRLTQTPRA